MASKESKLRIVVDAENRTQSAFSSVQRNLDAIKQSHAGLISAMKTVGTVGTIAFGSLSYLTKGIVEAGAGIEQTQIAFDTMLGSAEKARSLLGDLALFAAKTPFELPQVEEAAKRLLAYGTAADDLIPTLKMLGNIAAGVGMDKLPQLILAFGQVQAATRLTGMELRQFTEAGVPLLDTLAKQFGTTAGAIQEMVSEGKISFADVETALSSLTGEGGRFFNLMERQSASLGGQWSNLKDQISLTARTIGEELLPYLKPVVERLIEITQAVGAFVKEHPQLSAALLGITLAVTALTALLLPLAIALPGLIIMFGGLATAIGVVTAVSAPVLLAIGAIIAIMGALAANGYLAKEAWQNVWLGIKLIAAESANAVVSVVEGMLNFVISGVNKAIDAINRVIRLANQVPGVSISTVGKIDDFKLDRFDAGLIAADDLNARSGSSGQTVINVSGNTFLDEYTAEHVGDLIVKRLKMSNAI